MKLPRLQFTLRTLLIAAIVILGCVFIAQTVQYWRLREDAVNQADKIDRQHDLNEKRP